MNREYDLRLTELDDPKITEDGLLAKYKQNPGIFVDPDPNVYNDQPLHKDVPPQNEYIVGLWGDQIDMMKHGIGFDYGIRDMNFPLHAKTFNSLL